MTDSPTELVTPLSGPSRLKITDLRVATLTGVPFRSTIVRIDTDQGVSGYGEVRDQASASYALLLKSRLLGENPCNVEKLFRKIRQFGHHGRQGGGISGIEMALMDLAGKAHGVPVHALLGGTYRDRVLCYADTETDADPKIAGSRLRERRDAGFRFLKLDLGIDLLRDVPGALIVPDHAGLPSGAMHTLAGIQVTESGVEYLARYLAEVRSIIGDDIPLAIDHFGPVSLDSAIRIGRALESCTPAWVEDMLPWQLTDQWRQLTAAIAVPTCTGEDICLHENFRPLLEQGAVRVIHPDPATAGGIAETKRIGDLAEEYGVPMALHLAATPIATMAAVHAAAATRNFLALEFHAVAVPGWSGLVTGLPEPLVQDGCITVPDTPGLGFTGIDEEAFRSRLDPAGTGLFAPTDVWDGEQSNDRLWG